MAAKQKTHKVGKGDTLEGIAKKHKHKSWKTIWNDPANKGVKSKRKQPELIRAGDLFVIPPTEAERKKQAAEAQKSAAKMAQEIALAAHLSTKASCCEAAANAVSSQVSSMEKALKTAEDAVAKYLSKLAPSPAAGADLQAMQGLVTAQLATLIAHAMAAKKDIAKETKNAAKLANPPVADLDSSGKSVAKIHLGKTCPELAGLTAGMDIVIKAAQKLIKSGYWRLALSHAIAMSGFPTVGQGFAGSANTVRSMLVLIQGEMKLLRGTGLGTLPARVSLAQAKAGLCRSAAKAANDRSKAAQKAMQQAAA